MEEVGIDFILDTNILIYISQQNLTAQKFFENIEGELGISVISSIEFLMGIDKELKKQAKLFIDNFTLVPLDLEISYIVEETLKFRNSKSIRDPKFADIIIGSTATTLKIPLITNNPRDFAIFKNLEIIEFK